MAPTLPYPKTHMAALVTLCSASAQHCTCTSLHLHSQAWLLLRTCQCSNASSRSSQGPQRRGPGRCSTSRMEITQDGPVPCLAAGSIRVG